MADTWEGLQRLKRVWHLTVMELKQHLGWAGREGTQQNIGTKVG